ncbi:MAG: copper chaperone PCu(A)C [Candidatus Neomarinimicrobiota bacterium]
MIFNHGYDIVIKYQWIRPSAEKMGTALYFTLENNGSEADTLYAVETDIAKMVQIHETYSNGDVTGMREFGKIIIKPESSVKLEPGGMHIMVMRLKRDINKGDEIEFILHFRKAGEISIIAKAKKSSENE